MHRKHNGLKHYGLPHKLLKLTSTVKVFKPIVTFSWTVGPSVCNKYNRRNRCIQSNLNGSNTDGSFTIANSNSFLSPYEILQIDQENKYLRKFSYFIVKLYVICTH